MSKPAEKTREVTSFEYDGKRIRVILDKQGRLWWVAKEVCEVLGLRSPSVIVQVLDDDERVKKNLGRQGMTWLVNESGLHALIFRSNEPKAKSFRKWVTLEVLPTIYETGSYRIKENQNPFILSPIDQESSKSFRLAGPSSHGKWETTPLANHPVQKEKVEATLEPVNDGPKPLPDSLPSTEPVNLPPCSSTNHVSPNICLQSALFGIVKRGHRRTMNNELIASFTGATVKFSGQQFDQGDMDVFLQAVHLSAKQKNQRPDGLVQFTVRSFLKAIGRKPGKSGQEWLLNSIRRLTTSLVEIEIRSRNQVAAPDRYGGSLIDEFYFRGATQTYYLKINPKLAALFDAGWSALDWQQRLCLRTDLARWLHGFYASQQAPYPCKVSTIQRLCGSEERRFSNFRIKLRKALEQLVESGAIRSWEIDREDKVHVQLPKRLPESNQQHG
ncbi:plasmid replication initiator TrfA [Desulfolithobacter dissulfuricans]|uniref:plasmid replication initiator TrfA n=1 Tax=Desulfolithobacter dissulfuricans TaxID=2795293 RepID=UPI0022776BFE|nr:plasmid replication initiator TrfA [Desulfolithobacter dissulfuricans]